MTKLEIGVLVVGYMRAVNRFMTGGDRPGPLVTRAVQHHEDPASHSDPFEDDISISGYYHSLFEALEWANTLDNRLRRDWKPDWHTEVEDGESLPGIRWARNAVSHQWDEAVYLDTDGEGMQPRNLNVHWRWVPDLTGDRRDPQGRDAYADHLADQVVLTTLTSLLPVFIRVGVERDEFGIHPAVVRPTG